jgi:hypothetical protein
MLSFLTSVIRQCLLEYHFALRHCCGYLSTVHYISITHLLLSFNSQNRPMQRCYHSVPCYKRGCIETGAIPVQSQESTTAPGCEEQPRTLPQLDSCLIYKPTESSISSINNPESPGRMLQVVAGSPDTPFLMKAGDMNHASA